LGEGPLSGGDDEEFDAAAAERFRVVGFDAVVLSLLGVLLPAMMMIKGMCVVSGSFYFTIPFSLYTIDNVLITIALPKGHDDDQNE
jgi:hypothetical protein